MTASPAARLLPPVRTRIRLACAPQVGGAASGLVPFFTVADRRVPWAFVALAGGARALRLMQEHAAGASLYGLRASAAMSKARLLEATGKIGEG